jgi:hypothetical protein
MTVKVTNNGFSTLSAGITDSATTITLASGEGSRFPNPSSPDVFYATLIDTSNNLEIVKVTARSTDSLTVVRAQDNTSARAFSTGDRFELRPVAKLFEDIQAEARDLNGAELVLDADGDTSITADTDDQIDFKIGGSDRMVIDASGNVGIGTDAVDTSTYGGILNLTDGVVGGETTFVIANNNANQFIRLGVKADEAQIAYDNADSLVFGESTDSTISGITTERMRIDSSGNVGIGTSNPEAILHVSTGGGIAPFASTQIISESTGNNYIELNGGSTSTTALLFGDSSDQDAGGVLYNHNNDSLIFRANGSERMRITSAGRLGIGTTAPGNPLSVIGDAIAPAKIVRNTNDGGLVLFVQAGVTEGTITVSGSTVSYNGGHLSRWGRLPDGSQPTILKGTVMSNLDEMVVWSYDDVLYTEEDELPEGKSVGDVKTPAYTAENEQRNQLKISDVEGDINVAGLFVKWDTEEDGYNDIDLAMTGDMIIRIAQGTTVQRGDLLMSAGDGTAKPQGDDIVRSKTIAKVTSTTVINTYDDGSYVVPCVVMAC